MTTFTITGEMTDKERQKRHTRQRTIHHNNFVIAPQSLSTEQI